MIQLKSKSVNHPKRSSIIPLKSSFYSSKILYRIPIYCKKIVKNLETACDRVPTKAATESRWTPKSLSASWRSGHRPLPSALPLHSAGSFARYAEPLPGSSAAILPALYLSAAGTAASKNPPKPAWSTPLPAGSCRRTSDMRQGL